MKEVIIQVKISDGDVATAIKKIGFEDNASSNLEVIGLLQNLIALEQEKLNTVIYQKK